MRIIEPEVKLLAVTPNGEKLIEEAGRTCYLSLDRITDSSEKNFIRSCIKRRHLSILEHASASFRILGASRAFTHQLVRHRLASYSQQSQRYVDETGFNYIVPPSIDSNGEATKIFDEFMDYAQKIYGKLKDLGIKREDARYILPNASESQIVFSANFREFRTVFDLRLEKAAQWEIRRVCMKMLKMLQKEASSVFGYYIIDDVSITAKSEFIR